MGSYSASDFSSKTIFRIFFRANGHQVVQVKAKNPKTAEYLKWKITWEIEKFNIFQKSARRRLCFLLRTSSGSSYKTFPQKNQKKIPLL